MALNLLLLMGDNITAVYVEQIGNITIAVRYATVRGTIGSGRIFTFGYGDPADGSMHLDFYVTDNVQMWKFYELHMEPGGGYLEMYTEDGQFLRKEYP